MRSVIFTKQGRAGQQIEVHAYRYTACSIIGQVFVNGKYLAGVSQPTALKQPQGEITHYMGGGFDPASPGPAIGLTPAEAQQIKAALDAAQAAQLQTEEAQAFLQAEQRRTAALIREDEAREAMVSTRLMRDMDRADSDK